MFVDCWYFQCQLKYSMFYPRSPEVEPWVFRWTFFPSLSLSPFPHLQLGHWKDNLSVWRRRRRNISYSSSSSSSLSSPWWGGGCIFYLFLFFFLGGGGYCTVDRGSCAVYALLFISELRAKVHDGCKDLATISEWRRSRSRTDNLVLGF